VAIELSRLGRNVPFSFNRKEVKDHGEGGILVGAPLAGRVLIIDDVISAGTATRESVNIIRTAGATPKAVLILLDRQEKAKVKGEDVPYSATQFVSKEFGLEVHAVAKLDDLLGFLEQQSDPEFKAQYAAVRAYRALYGVDE
jgi:orotate phosphoribosyltransferase